MWLVVGFLGAVVLVLGGIGVLAVGLLDSKVNLGFGQRTYTQADVDAALLTVGDLPGYAVVPVGDQPSTSDDGMKPCGKDNLGSTFIAGTRRDASVSKSLLGPYVFHSTGLLRQPETLIADVRALFDCGKWTYNGHDYTASEANAGRYGDETYAVRMTADADGLGVVATLVVIRQGNLVSMLIVAGLATLSGDEAVAVARKAAAKLPAG